MQSRTGTGTVSRSGVPNSWCVRMRSGRPHTRSLVLAAVRARMSAGAGGCAIREELERRAALPAFQAPVRVTFAPRIRVYFTGLGTSALEM